MLARDTTAPTSKQNALKTPVDASSSPYSANHRVISAPAKVSSVIVGRCSTDGAPKTPHCLAHCLSIVVYE